MKFVSTRGRAPSVTAAEALVSGLAPDGGLYVPEYLPAPREDWEATADLTYAELAAEVLALFFTDWDKEELLTLCRKAYNGTFNMPGIIRVRKVGERRYFTELFHGRTLAFKDMALSLFPHLLQAAKKKLGRTETTLILTATSGDTGKAALAGFQDV
ncbi:MAG: threonine synthase, partial [Negativicoccus succinicivorans]|nr:threonine synthase [Negativicoccus succinicivorans]